MAGQENIIYIVEKLREYVHASEPSFTQMYRELNLKDKDFLAAVKYCTDNNDEDLFIELIKREYLNFTLVTQSFKILLASEKGLWIKSVILLLGPSTQDDGSEICVCRSVAESVWEYQEAGFKLLPYIGLVLHKYRRCSLSSILQRFLLMSPADQNGTVHLERLDKWFCNEAYPVGVLLESHDNIRHCFCFKNEVLSEEVSKRVEWCTKRKLHCVAMYMLFLHQDYEGMAQFISDNQSDISDSFKFIMKLGLQPAITKETLHVIIALFGLFEKRGKIDELFQNFTPFYDVNDKAKRQALSEVCQQRDYHMCAMYLLILGMDWGGVIPHAQSCGNPELVDQIIEMVDRYPDTWSVTSQLLDLSSRGGHVVAIVLLRAINKTDINMLRKLFDGDYEIDTNAIFQNWPYRSLSTICCTVREQDKEDIAIEMTQILIDGGLLPKFCVWIEQKHIDRCMANGCQGCLSCKVDYFEQALYLNMHRLLGMLLISGSVPSMNVYWTVQDRDKMASLQECSRRCAAMLIRYSMVCCGLQNLVAFTISREINVFPKNRRKSKLNRLKDISDLCQNNSKI